MMMPKFLLTSATLVISLALFGSVHAADDGQVAKDAPPATSSPETLPAPIGTKSIGAVLVSGNDRVEEEAIRVYIKSLVGEPIDPQKVDADIRAIYNMGFFRDVEARVTEKNRKTTLT